MAQCILIWGSPWNRKAVAFSSSRLAEEAAIRQIRKWLKFVLFRHFGGHPKVKQLLEDFEKVVSESTPEWAVKWFAYNNHLPGGDEWICQVVPLYESAD